MKVGKKVVYESAVYTVLFIYGNGQLEIQKDDFMCRVELVHISELQAYEETSAC